MTKNSIKPKKNFLITLFLILFALCLFIANYFSILILKTDSQAEKISSTPLNVYMLSVAKSKVKNEALSLSADYQSIGAGGFIWKNEDYFHVVASAYLNKNDAELVKNSIKIEKNIESEIFSVKLNGLELSGNFSAEQKKIVQKALSAAEIFYTSLYDIAISLDTGVYNETSAKLEVNKVVSNLSTIYANFQTLYPENDLQTINQIKNHLKDLLQISQKLAQDERLNKNQTYSSHLKYRYLEALSLK